MSLHAPNVSPLAACHVLWHFGHPGGVQPGRFTQHLLQAFAIADEFNFDKLAQAFPSYAAAVVAASYDPAGIQHLQRIAGQVAA